MIGKPMGIWPETTAREVLPVTLPKAAVMVAAPAETAVASPPLEVIVATDGLDEVQVTCVVMLCVVLSEYVPVAANCWVAPTETVGFAGVTVIKVREGAVWPETTAREVLPVRLPKAAVMVAAPAETAVASPLPELIVATDGLDEVQVTCVVMSCVVLSEYVPLAINCWVAPTETVGFAGVTVIKVREGAVGTMIIVPTSVVCPAATVTLPIDP